MMTLATRRTVLAGCAAYLVHPASSGHGAEEPDRSTEIARWMDTWMSEAKVTVGNLHLSRFVEPVYYLLKPTMWLPDPGQEGRLPPVTVPVGFVTDFASIPRIFWSLLRPDGSYTHPAIMHDFLYWTQTTSREAADEILRIMMKDFSIGEPVVTAVYQGVRVGGGSAWEANRKAREAGEKRILRKFPEDPTTRWEDWKRLPDVFQ
jgi:hypothetical protein